MKKGSVMPTYEYVCDKCGERIAVIRSMHEDAQTVRCEKCDVEMTRIWDTPGVVFKGGGWGGS